MTHYIEECVRCGIRRRPHGGFPETVRTEDINGRPIDWPPIKGQEADHE